MINQIHKKFWILHLITIATCSYLAAQTVSAFAGASLEGPRRKARHQNSASQSMEMKELADELDYEVIFKRNIFNSKQADFGGVDEVAQENQILDPSSPAVKSSLAIKLLGVLVIGNGEDRRSSAVISSGGGGRSAADTYFAKDEEKTFLPGVSLIKVVKDRVEFINKGRLEYIELEGVELGKSIFQSADAVHGKAQSMASADASESAEGITNDGEQFYIDQREVDEALNNLDKLVTEIRIVPILRGGKSSGFKVIQLKSGSLFAKIGIQRGDILKRVNGMELDMRTGMKIFSELKDQKNLTLDLVRRGQNKSLDYEIR